MSVVNPKVLFWFVDMARTHNRILKYNKDRCCNIKDEHQAYFEFEKSEDVSLYNFYFRNIKNAMRVFSDKMTGQGTPVDSPEPHFQNIFLNSYSIDGLTIKSEPIKLFKIYNFITTIDSTNKYSEFYKKWVEDNPNNWIYFQNIPDLQEKIDEFQVRENLK